MKPVSRDRFLNYVDLAVREKGWTTGLMGSGSLVRPELREVKL